MALYEYQAETSNGESVYGNLMAVDERTARNELESRGLKVVELLLRSAISQEGTLRDEELATLVHAIGGAAANRLPLEITLAALAEEKNDPRLAEVAQQLAFQLEQGATIEQVLAGLDRQLPPEVLGLMRAGVNSGDLAGTFERFGQQRLATQRIERRIRAALAYPLIIIVILVPLLLFLSLYVIPMFGEMFVEFDLDLPTMTELVLQTAKQLPMLIAGLLVFVMGIPIVLRIVGGRWLFHRVLAPRCPPGTAVDVVRSTRVCRAAGVVSQSAFADDRCRRLHGRRDQRSEFARACRRVTQRLETGEPLSGCLNRSIHFDRTLVALVAWGEQHGLLPEALASPPNCLTIASSNKRRWSDGYCRR